MCVIIIYMRIYTNIKRKIFWDLFLIKSQNLKSQNLKSQNLKSQNLKSQNLKSQNLKSQNIIFNLKIFNTHWYSLRAVQGSKIPKKLYITIALIVWWDYGH